MSSTSHSHNTGNQQAISNNEGEVVHAKEEVSKEIGQARDGDGHPH